MPHPSTSRITLTDPSLPSPAPRKPSSLRKGKDKLELDGPSGARALEGEEGGGAYAPREGQVRRKRKHTGEGKDDKGEGKRSKKAKGDEDKEGKTPLKKARRSKDKTSKPSSSRTNPSGAIAAPATLEAESKSSRGARKKRVRIAAPLRFGSEDEGDGAPRRPKGRRADSDDEAGDEYDPARERARGSSSDEDGARAGSVRARRGSAGARAIGEPEDAVLAQLAAAAAGEETGHGAADDYADPANLPRNPTRATKRYWRTLEYGVYQTALHDAARERARVGRVLVEWEGLRQRRVREEHEEKDAVGAGADGAEGADEDAPAAPARKRRLTMLRSLRRASSRTPTLAGPPNSTRAETTSPRSTPRPASEEPTYDIDGLRILPLPSSLELAKLARWPLHPSAFPVPSTTHLTLEDELHELYAAARDRAVRERRAAEPEQQRRATPRARSAYGPGGPLEVWGSPASAPSSLSSSSSSSDFSSSDEDDPAPSASASTAVSSTLSTLTALLTRLLNYVPPAPLPAQDLWTAQMRADDLRVHDTLVGTEREGGKVGWEEVVRVARESAGVPEHVADALEEQLIALFGPSDRPPPSLPPSDRPFPPPEAYSVKYGKVNPVDAKQPANTTGEKRRKRGKAAQDPSAPKRGRGRPRKRRPEEDGEEEESEARETEEEGEARRKEKGVVQDEEDEGFDAGDGALPPFDLPFLPPDALPPPPPGAAYLDAALASDLDALPTPPAHLLHRPAAQAEDGESASGAARRG
ncbi:hypothetical protein JCM10207_002211 [Rhodosporidiobolus poonsookiae]